MTATHESAEAGARIEQDAVPAAPEWRASSQRRAHPASGLDRRTVLRPAAEIRCAATPSSASPR
jgi:hypothetical protein